MICTLSCFLSVFDDEDENKLSYTDIHVQYKKLVSADPRLALASGALLRASSATHYSSVALWIAHSSARVD